MSTWHFVWNWTPWIRSQMSPKKIRRFHPLFGLYKMRTYTPCLWFIEGSPNQTMMRILPLARQVYPLGWGCPFFFGESTSHKPHRLPAKPAVFPLASVICCSLLNYSYSSRRVEDRISKAKNHPSIWPMLEHQSAHTVDGSEILHHLGCLKPWKSCNIRHINWCRISSINSITLILVV